jgi:hypothetical protein
MVKRDEKDEQIQEILTLDDLKKAEKTPLETKYYVSPEGLFLGGFATEDPAVLPAGAIEIDSPPEHGNDRLVDGEWDKTSRPAETKDPVKAALVDLLKGNASQYPKHIQALGG